MKKVILNRLHELLRNNFEVDDIECILTDPELSITSAVSDILREKFRGLSVDTLCKKAQSANRIKETASDVLRENVRTAINKCDYYSAWKLDACDLSIKAQQDVLDEFDYLKSLKSLSAFICHFTNNDKDASEIKKFLEFYAISTFVDHEDAGNFGGADWNNKIEKELKKRPIFILLAVDEQPTAQVKKEIDLYEISKNNDSLRINIILESLTEKSNGLRIDDQRQYIDKSKIGSKKAYNYLFKSILEKFKIGP